MHRRYRFARVAIFVVLLGGIGRLAGPRVQAAGPNEAGPAPAEAVGSPRLASAAKDFLPPLSSGQVTIPNCQVSIIEEAEIPAQESGVLSELSVRAGSQVRAGDLLARVSDRVAQLQKDVADCQYHAAKEKSENDINVRYAAAAAKVAEAAYDSAIEANRRVPDAIARSEVRRLRLEAERTKLQIEQAQLEQKLLAHELAGKAADLKSAEDGVHRRQIIAPCDGVIVEIRRHVGEWLNPGQTVLKVIRMDRMRIEAFLGSKQFDPAELADRPVRVDVDLGGDRRQTVVGRVVFVSPVAQGGSDYRIWVEVDNVRQNGHWLLKAGQSATMTVE